eukprot:TRINITY_DN2619_c0_g3_i1.p4 TRINITY_DN2619_c0_g3~~TRINITY_DN2619_c0_g3_i1.p4  ORF type:complete len:132 (-),score=2.43 TRINITY_DN2619_c0_g3_i1:643-1008(-)
MKSTFIFLFNKLLQSKSLNHGCCLTSSGPFTPNLLAGLLCKHYLIALNTNLCNEVSGFGRPSVGDIVRFDRYLARYDFLLEVFSQLALIRPFAHHQLVRDHSHGEIVDLYAVVGLADHFGC